MGFEEKSAWLRLTEPNSMSEAFIVIGNSSFRRSINEGRPEISIERLIWRISMPDEVLSGSCEPADSKP